jgi:dephospho-CoA kinase
VVKVGITGGIGSGKTTVCKIFETLGIPIYYADVQAKSLMVSNKEVVAKIQSTFGIDTYFADGKLNRKYLADKVFQDKNLLQQLNAIVHPAVFLDTQQWYQIHAKSPYTLYETAILYESGSYKTMDKIITVFAPLEDRITRTMKRDNCTREEVLARVNKQMLEDEKMSKADFVVYNDHSQPVIAQVLTIHQHLISLAQ